MVSGCFSPKALEHVVIAYDESVTKSLVEQLLINIARAHHHKPVHFTAISSIAATFNYQYTMGATPPLGGLDGGFRLAPIFGATIAENPTFTISPIEGEDFTQRLLTPLREGKLTLLLRQGVDIDLLLRLMAAEIRTTTNNQESAYYNRPSDKTGYPIFRQIVLHLSGLQDNNQLYIEPLVYDREWILPLSSFSAGDFQTLETNYRVIVDADKQIYTTSKTVDRAYRDYELRPDHHLQYRAIDSTVPRRIVGHRMISWSIFDPAIREGNTRYKGCFGSGVLTAFSIFWVAPSRLSRSIMWIRIHEPE